MKKRDQPHDRYFKDLMQDIEIAQEFLLTYLDKVISEQIDWNTLALYDGSLIGGANKQLYADVVYRAKTSKHKTDVFFILNHERKPDKLLPLRSLEYVLGTLKKTIKQQQKKPGLIIHITWYNGKRKPYPYARHIFDYFAEKELAQRIIFSSYKLINPHEIPDEELASHEQLGILELFMKHADNPKLLPWIEANRAIASKLAAHKYLKRSIESSRSGPVDDSLRSLPGAPSSLRTGRDSYPSSSSSSRQRLQLCSIFAMNLPMACAMQHA